MPAVPVAVLLLLPILSMMMATYRLSGILRSGRLSIGIEYTTDVMWDKLDSCGYAISSASFPSAFLGF